MAFPKLEWLMLGGGLRDKDHPSGGARRKSSPWSTISPLLLLLRTRRERGLGVKRLDLDFYVDKFDDTRGEFARDLLELKGLVEVLEYWDDKSPDS